MDTNLVSVLVEALSKQSSNVSINPMWNTIGLIAVAITSILGYLSSRETKQIALKSSETLKVVQADVNSGASAMREALAKATETILEKSKEVSELKEAARGQVVRDAVAAAVAVEKEQTQLK